MNVQDQLKPVATDAADPRIFAGKISPIISHGIGPDHFTKKYEYLAIIRQDKNWGDFYFITSASIHQHTES